MFSNYGEILRFKFLPAKDHLNGKAWIGLDSQETAKRAQQEIGGESGDFEIDGQACKIYLSDYELTQRKRERY